tara:strand:+ start:2015 stop:2332 length:318 start_codon:yes stop_codon:yes gene_type:complete
MIHNDLRQVRGLISRLQSSRDDLKSFVLKLRSSSFLYRNTKVSSENLSLRANNIIKEIDRLASELDLVYKEGRKESRLEKPTPRKNKGKESRLKKPTSPKKKEEK